MHAKDLSNLDLPSFDLHPSATGFHEHKRCFKHCLTDLKQPYLSYEEESCASRPLFSPYPRELPLQVCPSWDLPLPEDDAQPHPACDPRPQN